ncbi:hypothetical protein [Variovorax paradoxus]|nr:hypothetical protein RZE77_07615 [Variovorax paradoxus]
MPLGVVVLKLGALLLLVGYFAPVPPKKREMEKDVVLPEGGAA